MSWVKWLAVLPYLGILVGIWFVNDTRPFVFGMPLALAWNVGWVLASAVIMTIIYRLDPANRDPLDGRAR